MDKFEPIKKPNTLNEFSKNDLAELMKCTFDPIYFIENYIKVQHPIKGSVPLKLYDFQVDMVNGFHENRFVIGLTARQMGKCLSINTKIRLKSPQGKEFELSMGDFYEWQRFKQWAKGVPELQEYIFGQKQE